MAENNNIDGGRLLYFLIGAGLGAVTALLFAPKAGSGLRSDFADATRKGLDYARDTGHEIGERASDLAARGKDAVSELADRGKDLINRQKAQFAPAFEEGEQDYSEAMKTDQAEVGAAVEEPITK